MISIDTNVLLYSLNSDCLEHGPARAFVEACASRKDVAIAELVLVELYVLLRNPAVVRKPLEASQAAALCQAFRRHPHWALIHTSRQRRQGVRDAQHARLRGLRVRTRPGPSPGSAALIASAIAAHGHRLHAVQAR